MIFIIDQTSLPDLPQLMLATVEALKALGGSASIHDLDEAIIEREGVTKQEQALTMPNDSRPRVRYYLAWARTFLRRGGALENSARGIWALTDLGEKIVSRDQTVEIHTQVNEEERIRAREKRPVMEPLQSTSSTATGSANCSSNMNSA